MNWLQRLLKKDRLERQLDAELQFHLDQAVADGIRAGMSECEARRRALIELGGFEQVKEECRDARGAVWLETTLQDLRFAFRNARRSPGFAVAAICTLALGIGANTAIFSVVNAVFLRPLPYANPGRIASVTVYTPKREGSVNMPDYVAWKRYGGAFERLSAYQMTLGENLSVPGQGAERVPVGRVTSDFFAMLGVRPQLGRDFYASESEPGRNTVALISDSLWRSYLHSSPDVLGSSIFVGGVPHTIVGVMPPGFLYPEAGDEGKAALWLPIALAPSSSVPGRSVTPVSVVGRLKPGATLEQARADLQLITRRLDSQYPRARRHEELSVRVLSLQERLTKGSRAAIYVLMGAAGCILLIACANVANLFLARSTAREREIAIRSAIGASRFRVIRLLLAESLMLGGAGGLLGILIPYWITPALTFLLPGTIPSPIPIDFRVLGFAAACSLGAGIFFGLAPALTASSFDLTTVLKEGGGRAMDRRSGFRLRGSLASAQLALSLVLLVGAGLLMRSFVNLLNVNPGFDSRNVLFANVQLQPAKLYDQVRQKDFVRRAVSAVGALPGVESASVTSEPPLGGTVIYPHRISAEGEPAQQDPIYVTAASTGYFHALRIPLLQGRVFSESDEDRTGQVAVISQAAARMLFDRRNPLGRKIVDRDETLTVIGVVADIRHGGLDEDAWPELYRPYPQAPVPDITMVARGYSDPTGLEAAIRKAVQAIDPSQPVFGIETGQALVSASVAQRRQRAFLLGAFAFVSLLVALVGIYGVMAYSVARRTHDIGLRMALGAQRNDVLRMVVWEGLSMALIGVAVGIVLSLALTRVLGSFLFGVGPRDMATLASVSGALITSACLASYIPARRATRVDPIRALRHE